MLGKSKVFISNTDELSSYFALVRAFKSLGIRFNFKKAVIKINLCSLKCRETGATSDPIVVEQLVKLLNENNVSVYLVESNSSSKNADLAFSYLGFRRLEKKYDVKCVNLSREQYSVRKIDGYFLKSVKIPKIMETSEFFITHPKLKTHSGMKLRVTGALKNQFGCLMERNKAVYHSSIHEVIADVNHVFSPNLAVMDSIIAMTGYGPTMGIPQRLNLLLASVDPVAIDAMGAEIFGINPCSIKYLRLAAKRGIGTLKYEAIGDKIKNCNPEMHLNSLITRSFELLSSIGIKATSE